MQRINLKRRSYQPELMDAETTSFDEFDHCLRSLEIINILTLAYPPTLNWFAARLKRIEPGHPITLFDIGCGRGDMLRRLWARSGKRQKNLALTGVDLNPWCKKSAETALPVHARIHFETVNLFSLAADRKADFIISSLFTHHLSDDELIRFLQWMQRHAVRGWFVNDLHRHWLPYFFIKFAVKIFSSNRLIRHDAPVSVARAFTAAEWRRLLGKAGIPAQETRIRWHFPFRYSVAWHKN